MQNPVEQLHAAARTGDVPAIRAALASGASVNATDANLRTVVHYAALFRQLEVLQALADIAPDVDFEARDKLERRALHYCCFQPATLSHEAADNAALIMFLVERAHVDVPVRDSTGDTPLVLAAFHGLHNVVSCLLRIRTVGINIVGHGGLTAHGWAVKQGHLHVAALIAEAAAVRAARCGLPDVLLGVPVVDGSGGTCRLLGCLPILRLMWILLLRFLELFAQLGRRWPPLHCLLQAPRPLLK